MIAWRLETIASTAGDTAPVCWRIVPVVVLAGLLTVASVVRSGVALRRSWGMSLQFIAGLTAGAVKG